MTDNLFLKAKKLRSKAVIVIGVVILFLTMFPPCSFSGIEDVYAVRAGKIITVTGEVINNGIIIIRDGIIEAVGTGLDIPVGAEIIEADSMWIYPGFIDSHSSVAFQAPQSSAPESRSGSRGSSGSSRPVVKALNAEKLAADMLNPKDSKIAKMRDTGVTTVLTIPGPGIFSGQSVLINLAGDSPPDMILKTPVAMHITYSGQRGAYPSTLMAIIAFQRQTFLDAQHYSLLLGRYAQQKRGFRRPKLNRSLDALLPVLEKKMPVIIAANKENEIKRALKLADEFNLDYLISGGVEGWRVIDILKARKNPILVSLNFPEPEAVTGYAYKLKIDGPAEKKSEKAEKKPGKDDEKKETDPEKIEIYANAGVLHKSGLTVSFTSAGLKKPEDFIKNAALTVEHGMPKQEALKAMTINPAILFGVADQVGSIEEGKIANIVVASGDIFDKKTTVKYVFVDGKKFEIKKPKAKKTAEGEAKVDITGTWDVVVDSPDGQQLVTLVLTQNGNELTGEFQSEFGDSPLIDGSVNDNEVNFIIEFNMADQFFELVFQGLVEGNTIEGTIDLGPMGSATWTATKPGI